MLNINPSYVASNPSFVRVLPDADRNRIEEVGVRQWFREKAAATNKPRK